MSGSAFDLVVRGGHVVDGTGLPAFTADIGVRDGRIAKIGRVDEDATRVIDADGLVVTPGFIDIHTHYDAQLHWDPTASPASWHGVTTMLLGNCGFTLAPSKPEDVAWLCNMLSRVEGMSAAALEEGVTFRGGGMGDFLANLAGGLGVNIGANVGHCAVRRFVMGAEASERVATDDEIRAMQVLVRDAMREGAIGFTSSQLELHQDHEGRGVPSNYAAPEELVALCSVLAEFDHGAIEFIPRSFLMGYDDDDRALILEMGRVSGLPVNVNTLSRMPHAPDGWKRSIEFAELAREQGVRVQPMFATNRTSPHLRLDNTFLLDEMPTWRETLTLPPAERDARLRDVGVRDRLRAELADSSGRSIVFPWTALRVETVVDVAHEHLVDRTIAEIATDARVDPLDCFLDLALAEGLRTQFVLAGGPLDPARAAALTEMIRSPLVMAGASDGGAHLSSFVGADYTTRLLTEWVPDVVSFEAAVSKLTMAQARAHGLADRGLLRPGAAADLLVIDRDRLAAGAPRWVDDLPAGAGRFVVEADGYVATVVNGEVLLDHGVHTGAQPGSVLHG